VGETREEVMTIAGQQAADCECAEYQISDATSVSPSVFSHSF
jgi:hypothetical protein